MTQTGAHPCFLNALVFMTPDDKVQESGQVALSDAVFGILGVRDSVLMQDKHIEPLVLGAIWAVCRSGPDTHMCTNEMK